MHFSDLTKGNPRFRPCLPPKGKTEKKRDQFPKGWQSPPPHDYTDRTTATAQGRLADNKWIGSSGRIYNRMQDGSLRRVSPALLWRGKSDRRAYHASTY